MNRCFAQAMVCLFCAGSFGGQDPVVVDSPPVIMTSLPGKSSRIERLPDGTLVTRRMVRDLDGFASFNAVFTASPDDPLRWTDTAIQGAQIPQEGLLWLRGGDRNHLFFTIDVSNGIAGKPREWKVFSAPNRRDQAESRGGFLEELGPFDSSPLLRFASENVGAISEKRSIRLTVDAGATWNRVYAVEHGSLNNKITNLFWLDDERLLVTVAGGRIELLERKGNTLLRVWKTGIEQRGHHYLVADQEQALVVSGGRMSLIEIETGRIEASFTPQVSYYGIAICHGRILLWQADQLIHVDRVEGKERYVRLTSVRVPAVVPETNSRYIAGVVPLDADECLVFTTEGEAVRFDLETFEFCEPEALYVELAQRERVMNRQQQSVLTGLMLQLSPERRQAILDEAREQKNMDRRDQADWIIARMRKVIDETGPLPEPVSDPTRPTREEIIEFILLSGKLPSEKKFAIVLEGNEIPGLTAREQIQWMIEKMQEAVEEMEDSER